MRKPAVLYLVFTIWALLVNPGSGCAADIKWYHCRVIAAGNGYVKLTDLSPAPEFTGKWFRCPFPHAKSMVKTALQAYHARLNVNVRVYDYGVHTMIHEIYITQTP